MSAPVCEKLAWDSAFFGVSIARVAGDTLDAAKAAAVEAWCRDNGVACVYFLARPDNAATVRAAEAHGFALVDVRVELERTDLRGVASPPHVRAATATDLPALETIARTSFTDSRFYADDHFPHEKCAALYVRWVQESLRGFADVMLVAEQDAVAAGFVTCKIVQGVGKIGLVGVDPHHRGQGLGQTLMHAALAWLAGKSVTRVTVVTQARNLPSQRLYQRCGFLTSTVGLYYHKWFETRL